MKCYSVKHISLSRVHDSCRGFVGEKKKDAQFTRAMWCLWLWRFCRSRNNPSSLKLWLDEATWKVIKFDMLPVLLSPCFEGVTSSNSKKQCWNYGLSSSIFCPSWFFTVTGTSYTFSLNQQLSYITAFSYFQLSVDVFFLTKEEYN